jgi:hypothetical protein
MANNYFDATGVLVLDKVTPVIEALFGDYWLDKSYPGKGRAHIAKISESNDPQWDDILANLQELVARLGLPVADAADDSIADYLRILALHFGGDQDMYLGNLIEGHSFENSVELPVLFKIARHLDDGHGLRAMKIQGCWYCSKPRLYEFGGFGEYYGRHISMSSHSSTPLNVGPAVDKAIEAGDLGKAAECLLKLVGNLLAGVINADARETLSAEICDGLKRAQEGL